MTTVSFDRASSGRYRKRLFVNRFNLAGRSYEVIPQVARAEHYRHKIASQGAGSLGQADFWSQPVS